jgi:hypothetical protein
MRTRIASLSFIFVIFAGAGRAQGRNEEWSVRENEAAITFCGPEALPIVAGKPYSVDEVQEYTHTLADGKFSTESNVVGHLFRDSQGRTRTERARKPAPVWITEILDPVGGFWYVLDEQNKIAHRMAVRSGPTARPSVCQSAQIEFAAQVARRSDSDVRPAVSQELARPRTTSGKLDARMMQGVVVQGTRTTTLYPVHNGLPLRFTTETWDSGELQVTLLTQSSNGYTDRLTNLNRVEPDPARFQPPVEYAVVDENDSFKMTVKFHRSAVR